MSKEGAGPKGVGGIEVRGWGILDEMKMNSVLSGNRPPCPDFSSRTISRAGAISLLRVRTVRHPGHGAASLH